MATERVVTAIGEMNLADSTKSTDNRTTILTSQCACCLQPATQMCNGCADAPILSTEQTTNTFYCSTACQKANWEDHKKICKLLSARKRLYRAGDTVQQIFYVYREHAFEKLITKVEKLDDTLYLYEGTDYGDRVIVPFPHHLFSCKEDKLAALAYKACADAIAWLSSRIDEVEIKQRQLRETPLKTHHVDQNRNRDMTEYPHAILRITLRTAEQYAFDLSGAQHGYWEPVVPWATYLQSRTIGDAMQGVTFHPLGHHLRIFESMPNFGLFAITMRYNIDFAKAAASACEKFGSAEGHVPLSEVLKLPQKAYEHERADLISFISKALGVFNAEAKKRFKVTGFDLANLGQVDVVRL